MTTNNPQDKTGYYISNKRWQEHLEASAGYACPTKRKLPPGLYEIKSGKNKGARHRVHSGPHSSISPEQWMSML